MTPQEQARERIDEAYRHVMNKALSDLVMACMDDKGNPKAPDKRDLMKARRMVHPKYPGTLVK